MHYAIGGRVGQAFLSPQWGLCADLGFGKTPTRFAAVVTAIAALVALLYAHLQITEARRAERKANANELWRETLRLGFENPSFPIRA
jgi:hypothetical protein